jgi:hypothetical protein
VFPKSRNQPIRLNLVWHRMTGYASDAVANAEMRVYFCALELDVGLYAVNSSRVAALITASLRSRPPTAAIAPEPTRYCTMTRFFQPRARGPKF